MAKGYLEFSELDDSDQEWYLKETWCDKCSKADLGIKDPAMYKENGNTFVTGKCVVCGEPQTSQVITKQVDG